MKAIFKKISAIAASALMVGMSMGAAAAAAYPSPFVSGGAADVAIVYGANAASSDHTQGLSLQTDLAGSVTGGTTIVGGDVWEVGTSTDSLEIGESIKDVYTYIGKNELDLLADGTLSNEKGTAAYKQYFYFNDAATSYVTYTEDDDYNIGLFYKINSGAEIAKYVMSFTTSLKSDIETDNELSDIEDKELTFLGKTYKIVTADNGSKGTELTMMSGPLGGTVVEGTPLTVGSYTVSVSITSATDAVFTINGEQTSSMAKGDSEKLSSGDYFIVSKVSYEGYADGTQSADFYIGGDKIEWKNGSDMTVNGETINEADVTITQSEASGDVSISEIAINMSAEDNLYVPANSKLSEAANLDEPEVLVSQNWDIHFGGLEAVDYEDISLTISESDQQYDLTWQNHDGDELTLPLVFVAQSSILAGEDADKRLVLNPNGTNMATASENITRNDYFFLSSADPKIPTSNAKTVLVQYKSADNVVDTDPQVTLNINGEDREFPLSTTGTFTVDAVGTQFSFRNDTDGTLDNFEISLDGPDYSNGAQNNSVSVYIRTYYNTLINITSTNATDTDTEAVASHAFMPWKINVSIDDANRDGDDNQVAVNAGAQVFEVTIANSSATPWEASSTVTKGATWLTDNSDSTIERFVGNYGYEIVATTPSSSPISIEAKVPKNIVRPIVSVIGGDVEVSAGSSGVLLITDADVGSASSKNLIIVGGSCINTAAASVLGVASGTCEGDWTTATSAGANQYIIETFGSSEQSLTSKIAVLVAGYEAADTVNAVTYLKTNKPDVSGSSYKYVGTSA